VANKMMMMIIIIIIEKISILAGSAGNLSIANSIRILFRILLGINYRCSVGCYVFPQDVCAKIDFFCSFSLSRDQTVEKLRGPNVQPPLLIWGSYPFGDPRAPFICRSGSDLLLKLILLHFPLDFVTVY